MYKLNSLDYCLHIVIRLRDVMKLLRQILQLAIFLKTGFTKSMGKRW